MVVEDSLYTLVVVGSYRFISYLDYYLAIL
jgi:hypothetical protein